MSSSGGGGDTHTTTSTNEPPAYLKPYLQNALSSAQGLYQGRPLYSSTTPPSYMDAGMQNAYNHALSNPLLDASRDYVRNAVQGHGLNPTAIGQAAQPFVQDYLGAHNRGWEGAGGTGGSLEAEAAGRGIANVVAQQYGRERALQQGAAGMAPALESADLMGPQALLSIGGMQRQWAQQAHDEPWRRLGQYAGIAFGNSPGQLAGSSSVSQQPIYQPSPFSQVLGAAASVAPFFL